MMSILQAIENELSNSRAALLRTAGEVPESKLHIRPSTEEWSVAEILHHLVLVENRIVDRLGQGIAQARANGVPEPADPEPHLRSIDYLHIERVVRKIQTRNVPEAGHDRAELLASLAASRERLLAIMRDGAGFDLSGTTAQHPALGELNLYQWLMFVARHEDRHRGQIERVVEAVNSLPTPEV